MATNREQLLAWMEAGEVDLSVMGRAPREIGARAEAFAAHPLVFVCPPGHALLRIGHPPVSALEGQPFIVRERGAPMTDATPNLLRWRERMTARPAVGSVVGPMAAFLSSGGRPVPDFLSAVVPQSATAARPVAQARRRR